MRRSFARSPLLRLSSVLILLLAVGPVTRASAGEPSLAPPAGSLPAATEALEASADPVLVFNAANAALAVNDFPAAEAGYRSIISSGIRDGDVYYNLGNVLYREDHLAQAILAWRHASLLSPRDPDVEANLDFARRRVRDRLEVTRMSPWFAPWQVALSGEEGAWFGGVSLGLGLLAVGLRRRFGHIPILGAGLGLGALGLLVGAGGLAQQSLSPSAVVLSAVVTATSDLGGGVDLFTLHAGAEVETEQESAGRVLIRLPDGRRGWVAADAVGLVDPGRPFPVL